MKTRKVRQVESSAITRDLNEMLPHVQIPDEPTKEVKFKVREVVLKPVMTDDEIKAREGTYFDEKGIKEIFDEDVDVYGEMSDGSKKLLAKLRKNVIPKDTIKLGWEAFYRTAAPSRSRGPAAGPIDVRSNYWKKRKPTEVNKWSARYYQNGKKSAMRVNNNVFSSVLGYFEKTPFMGLPCRLTSYTQKYFQLFKQGIPYLEFLDSCFKKLTPENHALQLERARKQPHFQIADTAFSSATLNRNFRTALHKDAGDFSGGFGNLSVLEYGKYSGGYTLFPQFGVGFNIRTGDFIAMDVHQWHCNTEMTETAEQKEYNKKIPKLFTNDESTGILGQDKLFTRISFVCYLREKILENCKYSDAKQYYKRIHFSEKTGVSGTRKNKATKQENDAE